MALHGSRSLSREAADVAAPVQTPKGWTLAINGKPMWGNFSQVWKQVFAGDGQKLAAVVAVDVGKWTMAVDGTPWNAIFNQWVSVPVFSPDGKKVAAAVKNNNRWTVAVDGSVWPDTYDNVWDPVFSPGGDKIVAKAEKEGQYFVVVRRQGRQARI